MLCPACGGSRLTRSRARSGSRADRSTSSARWPISELLPFFRSLSIEPGLEKVVAPLVAEIVGRLEYLVEVGLEYLTLDRGSDTLSGGELQRARLAAQLGSGLVGVCTILDEPTAGLHPRDTARLISSPATAAGQGNSVLVVEHDVAVIRAADWVVDLGPGRGPARRHGRGGRAARSTGRRRGVDHRPVSLPRAAARRRTRASGWQQARAGSRSAARRFTT